MSSVVRLAERRDASGGPRARHVVIVGGGFSGAALAAQLMSAGAPALRVTLVERNARIGPGLAYGTEVSRHLLNTRAGSMSLVPEDPDHFVRWLRGNGHPASRSSFVPRLLYGRYVEQMLIEMCSHPAAPALTTLAQTAVTDVVPSADGGFAVLLSGNVRLEADAVVLATGHPPPADPLGAWLPAAASRYVRDAWSPAALDAIPPFESVLLLGTGLTMIDAAIALDANGHRGPIDALSRRGLLPREHVPATAPLPPELARSLHEALETSRLRCALRAVRGTVRAAAERGVSWHAVIDALRGCTARLWTRLDATDRRRFVKLLRPYWDVHRHRMAPAAARHVRALQDIGRLQVLAGHICAAREAPRGIAVEYRPRGSSARMRLEHAWVVNCTGPRFDRRHAPALDRLLLERGLLVADPLGLGYLTDERGMAFGARGPVSGLYLLGPACRPRWWEHTAAQELREQAAALAARLLGSADAAKGRRAEPQPSSG